MKRFFFIFCSLACSFSFLFSQENLPKVSSGKLIRIENFKSKFVSSRIIDVWLPDSYDEKLKHQVFYMQDGQMLYDSETTWNKQAWDIDDVGANLFKKDSVKPFIVVGIWNGGLNRHPEYFPQKPFESLSKQEKENITKQLQKAGRTKRKFKPKSDKYLKFIVQELKPYIDSSFSVNPNKEATFIGGSSMGGLISIYAMCEYPSVFGGVACLSTHWVGTFTLENNPFPERMKQYLNKNIPENQNHKIYFDCGDQTIDALYPKIQKEIDAIFFSKKYTNTNFMSLYFPGENHSEKAWKNRLSLPLKFLFKR